MIGSTKKNGGFWVAVFSAAFLLQIFSGCSKGREVGLDVSKVEATEYPHPKAFVAKHVEVVSSSGNAKSCVGCHNTQKKVMSLGASVSCGASCHSAQTVLTAAPRRVMVRVENECSKCHEKSSGVKFTHYPSLAGMCVICHQAQPAHLSGADPKAVSTLSSETSCYRCHSRKDDKPRVHTAIASGKKCSNCHDPHGSDHRSMARQETAPLCLSCHDQVPHAGKSVHAVTKDQRACLNCHEPHSSAHSQLLVATSPALCLSCHDREIPTADPKRVVSNIKKRVQEMPFVHTPAGGGASCTESCHNPHGSENDRLLTENFSLKNYNRFAAVPNPYALCVDCHGNAMFNKAIGPDDTGFRNDTEENGQVVRKNLHWFHVVDAAGNSNKDLGRSCGVCHDPHGAPQKFNVDTSFKMGNQEVTLAYTPNANGGQCARTCHGVRSYQRIGRD
jgi:predicted CXXCH cytochrome family protein